MEGIITKNSLILPSREIAQWHSFLFSFIHSFKIVRNNFRFICKSDICISLIHYLMELDCGAGTVLRVGRPWGALWSGTTSPHGEARNTPIPVDGGE